MPHNSDPKATQLSTWVHLYVGWFRGNTSAFIHAVLPAARQWQNTHPGYAAANAVRARQSEKAGRAEAWR